MSSMKRKYKVLAAVLALAMILSLVVSVTGIAYALDTVPDSSTQQGKVIQGTAQTQKGVITIQNAIVGQVYTAYKLFDLESYAYTENDIEHGAFVYTLAKDSAWRDFFEKGEGAGYAQLDADDYILLDAVSAAGASAQAAFASAALTYALENQVDSMEVKAEQSVRTQASDLTTTSVEFSDLDLGYYLITSSLGTVRSLVTTAPTTQINEKNGVPTLTLLVQENVLGNTNAGDWGSLNDASVHDTVHFKAEIAVQTGAENFSVAAVLPLGLDLHEDSIQVYKDTVDDTGLLESADNYEIVLDDETMDFGVNFVQSFMDTMETGDTLLITYSARINTAAIVGEAGNVTTMTLTYGANKDIVDTASTTTHTWDIPVYKYTVSSTENGDVTVPLAGAQFQLSTDAEGNNPVYFSRATDENGNYTNVYCAVDAGADGAATLITTQTTTNAATSGRFTLSGLNSGVYYLSEIKAPDGYNRLASPIEVVIEKSVSEDGGISTTVSSIRMDGAPVTCVEVENRTGWLFPQTGGIGTTPFYIAGSFVILCAVCALVVIPKVQRAKLRKQFFQNEKK